MSNKIDQLKKASGKFGSQWAALVLRFRWPTVVVAILAVMSLAMGAANLGFDADYRVFFKDDNPQKLAYDEIQRKYTQDDNVLLVIEPTDGKIFTKEHLGAIEEITGQAWQTPFSTRVDAISNFQHTYAKEDDLFVEDLVESAETKSADELDKIKQVALSEPLLVNRLISKEGHVAAINITVQLPGEDPMTEGPSVIEYCRNISKEFEQKHPELKTHLSGLVMLSGAFFEASEKDSSTLIPLMFLAIIVAIYFSTRTISGTFTALLVIVFSIMAGMGFAGHMGIKLTPPSGAAPIIIMTLAVADSVHILISFRQAMQRGLAKNAAIIESLRVNFMPVFITSLTTVIGFLSMNTAEVPPFQDLGNITAVGMTAAFLLSVTLLPALISLLPVKIKVKETSGNSKASSNGIYAKLAEFVIAQRRAVLIGSVFVIAAFSYLAVNIELNDEFVKYFDDSISFRKDTDFIDQELTGIYNAEFSIGAGEAGGINNPEYLQKLEKFELWLQDQPEVVHVNAYTEIARRVNRSMHGDNEEYYRIPTNREEAAQYLLLYEMSLPFGLDLNNQVNVDKSETRLTVTMQNVSSNQMIVFVQRAEQWLKDNTPAYMHSVGISPTMMFAYLSGTQIRSLILGTALALGLISLILIFALKSLRFGLLSLIPNIAPIAIGFGIWALLAGQINIGISIVFGMTLGIIVDDTIHFMSKYLSAIRDYNYSSADAIRYAFNTVGKALLVTTLVLVAGFAILSQSSFGMNSGMAKVTSLVIVAALIVDFLLLPALLLLLPNKQHAAIAPQPVEVEA